MATGKRFYWMKLKESFMTSDTIDYFMAQPGGANYVVLYQMLCLKTINTDGKLSRQLGEVIIPYDVEKIVRDCRWFSADTVRVALNLYKAVGLIYEDQNGTLVIADHENLVGSETDWAQKKRRQQAEKALPPADAEEAKAITDGSERIVCRKRDVKAVMEAWNALGLTQIQKISSDTDRGVMLRKRINDYGTDKVLEAIGRIKQSSWLQGQNSAGWTITFDWFIKPNNFLKVLEGNYADQQEGGQSGGEHQGSAGKKWGVGYDTE